MKGTSIRAWKARAGFPLAVIVLAFCASKLAGEHAAAIDITRKAYRIAHNGQIDTDLQVSEFFNSSFTLAAWVMPEFAYNWKGAIFAVDKLPGSGSFWVGQGDYESGNGGFKKAGDPVLEVKLNGVSALYLAPGYERRKWNHIAISRGNTMFVGPTLRLFLNGKKLQAFTRVKTGEDADGNPIYTFQPAVDLSLGQSGNPAPEGTLRLGRHGKAQFYGLIDDVAVYNRSMDPAGITELMNSPISGTHPNLVAAFTFDTYTPGPLVLVPKYQATPNARAFSVKNAHPHNNSDSVFFDNPFLVSPSVVVRRLPFSPGQIWEVTQEFDVRGGSHNGTAAFSWDFSRRDTGTTEDPVIAAAPGLLSFVKDAANGAGVIEVVPGEEADVYMHTADGTWWDTVVPPGTLFYPQPTMPMTWLPIVQDQPLATLYGPENHLHRSVRRMGNGDGTEYTPHPTEVLGSIPSAFDNYQRFREDVPQECNKEIAFHWLWDDCWVGVLRGMPRKGQLVRRIN